MKNKYKKILAFVLTIILVIVCNYTMVFAETSGETIDEFGGKDSPTGTEFIQELVNTVLTLIRVVAAGLAIIMITVMATKYMAAAASEKAEIKNKMINLAIGIFLVAGATGIIQIAIDAALKLKPE